MQFSLWFPSLRTALALCLPTALVLQSAFAEGTAAAPGAQPRLLNASFEEGLTGWRTEGDVRLETDAPIQGAASLRIGPVVGSVSQRLSVGHGGQSVDVTAISEAVYAARKPKDCVTDPLHPNDYLSRWYAQALTAALDPDSGERSGKTATGPVVSRVNP